MKVFYHETPGGNVGDDLNAVLWQRLIPELAELGTADWLVGIGTILDERLNALEGRRIVMGSGLRIAGDRNFTGDIRFAAVRGLLTARELRLGSGVALGDPGFLVDRLWQRKPLVADGPVGLVPHVYSERWSAISQAAQDAGFKVISPTLPLEQFLEQLGACSRVFCESLHGAIFADALRIPWARSRICSHYYEGDGVSEFKWRDAFSIVGLQGESATRRALIPIRRKAFRPMQAIAERRFVNELRARRDSSEVFRLSRADRLQERTDVLLRRIDELRSRDRVDSWSGPSSVARHGRTKGPRVLVLPKNSENTFVGRFSATLESAGATVDDFSYRRALTGRHDVLHLHWPDSHLMSGSWWGSLGKHARLAMLLGVLRMRGTRVVWMLHNLAPHDRCHWLSMRLFPMWFPRACTHVIALTQSGLDAARERYPALNGKPAAVIPHGHYRDEYPASLPREMARERLGVPRNAFTILFFGNIRRYKNVPALIERFRAMPGDAVHLIVAGQPGHGIDAQEIEKLCGGDPRITLHLKFIPDTDVPVYFGVADVVVSPFDSILNSGSVLLALSFNRVVLAPRLGALPEIQQRVGNHWLRLYDGPLTTAHLQQVCSPESVPTESAVDLSAFDWNSIADQTLELYLRDVDRTGAIRAGNAGAVYEEPRNEYSKT